MADKQEENPGNMKDVEASDMKPAKSEESAKDAPGAPRFMPSLMAKVKVPEAAKVGQPISFPLPDGTLMQAIVPPDKKANDEFEVQVPPSVVLTVPEDGKAGGIIVFQPPNAPPMQAFIPEGKTPGDTFTVMLLQAPPTQATLTVPDGVEPGGTVFFTGPGGVPMQAIVPEGKKAGDTFTVPIQVPPPMNYHFVTVPKGCKAGDVVKFPGPHGQEMTTRVPEGKEPGDTFTVQIDMQPTPGPSRTVVLKVPADCKAGDMISFQAQDGQQMSVKIPDGLKEGDSFSVNVQISLSPEQQHLGQLCNAASGEDLEAVKKWVSNGVPLDGEYDLGFTALIYAAMNGRLENVRWLLDEKADVAKKTHDNRTALHFACRNGHIEVAKLLLERKVPTDVKDVLGRTALATAIEKGQKETVEAMKAAGLS